MATTPVKVYGHAGVHFDNGGINWVSDTIKLSLHTSSYAVSQANDEFFSSVTNELTTAGGYTAGGITLASKSVSYDATSRSNQFFAANISVANLTPSSPFRYGVVRKDTGVAGTSILICYLNFGTDVNPAGGPFAIVWASTGVHYDQAS